MPTTNDLGVQLRMAANAAVSAPDQGPHVRLVIVPEGVRLDGRWLTSVGDFRVTRDVSWLELEYARTEMFLANTVTDMLAELRDGVQRNIALADGA